MATALPLLVLCAGTSACSDAGRPAPGSDLVSSADAGHGDDAGDDTPATDGGTTAETFEVEPISVAAGASHTCAVVAYHGSRGTERSATYCWGADDRGQRGTSAGGAADAMSVVALGDGAVLKNVQAASLGDFTCGIDDDSAVWCWGKNDRGQAGAPPSASKTPARLTSNGIPVRTSTIALGVEHGCATFARVVGTSVACWGDNTKCQLGLVDPDTGACSPELSTEPVVDENLEDLAGATLLTAGSDHTCAAGPDDAFGVRCWGGNGTAQCGASSPSTVGTPRLAVASNMTEDPVLAAGAGTTCALGERVRCWGDDGAGELTGSPSEPLSTPTVVGALDGARTVKLGAGILCVVDESGGALCQGKNDAAQLGRGVAGESGALAAVAGLEDVTDIALGGRHGCAIARGAGDAKTGPRSIHCWGSNSAGQADPASAPSSSAFVTTPHRIEFPVLAP